MMNKMKTDINRLHEVYDGKLYGRGVGKTFLKIHTLVGIVEVGEFDYIFLVLNKWIELWYLHKMIDEIFEEHNLKITQRYKRGFDCNNKHIRFTINKDLYDNMRGLPMADIVRIESHNLDF